ncbi:NAD(P)/FAD-dependent oxidoreductase [Aldersonia sp. NBC_00410]|uniref:flavin-containing monooxygenase n=1 Tax=Aldersonia sp. NBC_00410 TaxID=2975954 RepID=UPI00225BC964|nr:NAD(P)/FAD-dependent oxidoreductase [Aldersonia sp. NBC_00410]MCX5041954.1 NAD(P)/FAD-dependent oxidoreductase [Aldersonia sp. NBC_00410]
MSRPNDRGREETKVAEAEHVDVLIVGAGLSGIGAAHHIQQAFPGRTYTVLESRDAIGGTWDLFRYPGIRSDSDMYTLGYRFRPWLGEKAIADGPSILEYVRDTARESGIDRRIRFHHKVTRIEWSSARSQWTVTVQRTDTGETLQLTANFVMASTGYYRYDQGYTPEFPGLESFAGTVVHPQHWPESLDYAGKRVVIIGSGATAVTLAPNMADEAEHVTVLQRSPSYILSLPGRDSLAARLRGRLPVKLAYRVVRTKNVLGATALYQLCQRYPKFMRGRIRSLQQRWLPPGYDIDTHFKPRYNPWDQRLCLAPDGDIFRAVRNGTVSFETDTIDTFTESGVALSSGKELPADIVITATGLNLQVFGGITVAVDGHDVDLTETMAYRGMMLSGVPNFVFIVGYTNASWTLKADLVCEYTCRLLAHMDSHGYTWAAAQRDPSVGEEPFLDFSANYVLRSVDSFPKQGSRAPWRLRMNYLRDLPMLRHSRVETAMAFGRSEVVPLRTGTSARAAGRRTG